MDSSDGAAKPSRRELLLAVASLYLTSASCTREEPRSAMTQTSEATKSQAARQPLLFVGHGSPMNAIEDNAWSQAFKELGQKIAAPKAILCVSAHWYVPGTFVTDNAAPKTIHDFGGFPRELFEVQYPARGDGALASHIVKLLDREQAAPRSDWGLDHGTWSVLVHLFPKADVPVLQLSIDRRAAMTTHLSIGKGLSALRDEGVLIIGSGNVTHNLRHAFTSDGKTCPPWAATFDADVARAMEQRDHDFLARALDNEAGRLSHPSPDHYLPLLYVAGAASQADRVSFPITGFDYGSLSMRSVLYTA